MSLYIQTEQFNTIYPNDLYGYGITIKNLYDLSIKIINS